MLWGCLNCVNGYQRILVFMPFDTKLHGITKGDRHDPKFCIDRGQQWTLSFGWNPTNL
jgi:hypothetical protein